LSAPSLHGTRAMKAALGAIAAGADPAAKAAQYKALAGDCEQSTADSAVVGLLKEMVTHSSCGIFLRNFFGPERILKKNVAVLVVALAVMGAATADEHVIRPTPVTTHFGG
jgi:hypothetical protein